MRTNPLPPAPERIALERMYLELVAVDQDKDAAELLALVSMCQLEHLRLLLPSWPKTEES